MSLSETEFIVDGIYFKFARDWCGIYGDDQVASKAAGHELLSLRSVLRLEVPGLDTPMTTLIDYCGYRVTAMSLLPIDTSTIVYGSSDGGLTVNVKDAGFLELMQRMSQSLNLKRHVVGRSGLSLATPGDLEGHRGLDGHYYLVDAARLFPPEAPVKTAVFVPLDERAPVCDVALGGGVLESRERWLFALQRLFGGGAEGAPAVAHAETAAGTAWYQACAAVNRRASVLCGSALHGNVVLFRRHKASTLYRLLRPELVGAHATPLCSDAWTRFQEGDPARAEHNREVLAATARLLDVVIPAFADSLNRHVETPETHRDVSALMHAHGINMRFLGRVRRLVTLPHLRSFLLTEIVSRVCKDDLRARLRGMCALPAPAVARRLVRYFNLLVGHSRRSQEYWALSIKSRIQYKFIYALTPEEADPAYDLRRDILLFPLFCRVCENTGVAFKRGAARRLFEHPFLFTRECPLAQSDFSGLAPIRKSATFLADRLAALIEAAVDAEEQPTRRLVEQVGDPDAVAAFKVLRRFKVHRRIETLLGPDSEEAVQSFFSMAQRHLKTGASALALDAAIKGLSYGQVLFGPYSDAVVKGEIMLGKIYEKQRDLPNAVLSYKKAVQNLQRLHRQHPLVGVLCSKIYFCTVALRSVGTASASSSSLRGAPHTPSSLYSGTTTSSATAATIGAGTTTTTTTTTTTGRPFHPGSFVAASLAGDPGAYLCQAFASFTDVFGADAALLMVPLVAVEHCDPSFVASIQETMQNPDTTQSFRDIVRDLWPQSALADVSARLAEQQRQQQQQHAQSQGQQQQHWSGVQQPLLQELLQTSPEQLLQRGVIDSDDMRRAQEALAVLTRLHQKAHQSAAAGAAGAGMPTPSAPYLFHSQQQQQQQQQPSSSSFVHPHLHQHPQT